MPQYTVRGKWKSTGEPASVSLIASSADEARLLALEDHALYPAAVELDEPHRPLQPLLPEAWIVSAAIGLLTICAVTSVVIGAVLCAKCGLPDNANIGYCIAIVLGGLLGTVMPLALIAIIMLLRRIAAALESPQPSKRE